MTTSLGSIYSFSGFLAVLLALIPSAPPREPMPVIDSACPKPCLPNVYEDLTQAIGGTCATINNIVLGSGSAGTGDPSCNTCTVCSKRLTMSWSCNGSCGCTYVWENHSFDTAGNPLPVGSGTGHGDQSIQQALSSNCNGEHAELGVSVGGSRRVWVLYCECLPL